MPAATMMRALVITCLLAGVAYADGSSGKPHCASAGACEKACAKGDGQSCWYAGAAVAPGDAGGDMKKAKAYFDRACKLRVVDGCLQLSMLERQTPGDKGLRASNAAVKRAIALQAAACAKKKPEACDAVVAMYTTRLDTPDEKNAATYREKACRIRTNAPCPPPCADDGPVALQTDAAAKASNEKNFEDELVRQKLDHVKLVSHSWNENTMRPGDEPPHWRIDAINDVKWGTQTLHLLGAPDFTASHCDGAEPTMYVRRGDTIYRIVRAPKVVSSKQFQLCGCGRMCGGAAPATYHMGFELPAGAKFGGALTITYDVDNVSITYKQRSAGTCSAPP